MGTINYLIGHDYIIKEIGGDWDNFAVANGAPELTKDKVIGNSIFDYITGKISKSFYETLFEQVNKTKKKIQFSYRCDSPEQKRFMELSFIPLSNAEINVISKFLGSETKRIKRIIYTAKERSKESKVRCSICNQIKHNNEWIESEDLPNNHAFVQVIYGVCINCHERITVDY